MTTADRSGLDAIRSEIATGCRRLATEGMVVGTAGNVSVRLDDRVAITATGARFEELAPEQVTVVGLDGRLLDGDLAPTSELDLHLGIYRRFGTSAVVHTHARLATAVGLVTDELPCVHYQMLLLGGSIRVAPYATFGTPELAESVLTALDGKAAALMANHGAVTHANDLPTALDQAFLLEWACSVYWHAAAIGTPRPLTTAEQESAITAATTRQYGKTRPASSKETR